MNSEYQTPSPSRPSCIFAYFIVDNYDKYQFCIFSLIKFAYDKSGEIKCDVNQYEITFSSYVKKYPLYQPMSLYSYQGSLKIAILL